jgi:predicted Zn-dependent protease
MGEVDALIREKPDNPYFMELKGNLYYWAGKYQDSVAPLRNALKIVGGNEALFQSELAQSLLATDQPAVVDEAIGLLRRAIANDDANAIAHRHLATAYYRKGQAPQADLSTAQAYLMEGNVKQAQIFAKRALAKLPRGTPEWIRAEDIVNYKEPT